MAARQPTNSVILKAVQQVKDMQASQAKDIGTLMNWKLQEDAYRAALKQVKSDDEQAKFNGLRDTELKKRTEIMKQAGIVLALIVAILYAYAATHGIKTP